MSYLTKEEAVNKLIEAQASLEKVHTKDEALKILDTLGGQVGYAPAFRALVKGMDPFESIRWH